jgi:hypothetical protein
MAEESLVYAESYQQQQSPIALREIQQLATNATIQYSQDRLRNH